MISDKLKRGIRAAQAGLLTNLVLVLVKLLAGIFGNTYALIADAVESSMDIFASLIVWGGLSVAATPADKEHPFGHGKAEAIAAAVVSMLLIVAAIGIAAAAVREIITPHGMPAAFTLFVAGGVIVVKETLFRRVFRVGSGDRQRGRPGGRLAPPERRHQLRRGVHRDRHRAARRSRLGVGRRLGGARRLRGRRLQRRPDAPPGDPRPDGPDARRPRGRAR